jgi:hypothetical protein
MKEQITRTISTKFGPMDLDENGGFLEGRWRFIDLFRSLEKEVGSFMILCETNSGMVPCSFGIADWPRLSKMLCGREHQPETNDPVSVAPHECHDNCC